MDHARWPSRLTWPHPSSSLGAHVPASPHGLVFRQLLMGFLMGYPARSPCWPVHAGHLAGRPSGIASVARRAGPSGLSYGAIRVGGPIKRLTRPLSASSEGELARRA